MAHVVGVAPQTSQLMNVTCPQGYGPGTQLQVRNPQGQLFNVVVPQGVYPGQTFQVRLPATAPATTATAAMQVAAAVVMASPRGLASEHLASAAVLSAMHPGGLEAVMERVMMLRSK